jgi:hypothetical protein
MPEGNNFGKATIATIPAFFVAGIFAGIFALTGFISAE